jgi:hypothetical protein
LRFGDWLCLSWFDNFSWSWLGNSNRFCNSSWLSNGLLSNYRSFDSWCWFSNSNLSNFLWGSSYWCLNYWLSYSLWHNSWWLLHLSSNKPIIRRSCLLIIKAHLKLRSQCLKIRNTRVDLIELLHSCLVLLLSLLFEFIHLVFLGLVHGFESFGKCFQKRMH